MRRRLLAILLLLFVATQMYGTKSYPAPIAFTQPDGTVIHILIKGDESFTYKLSSSGYLIAQAEDGYYYYVSYVGDKYEFSNQKVTDSGVGISKTIPNRTTVVKSFYPEGKNFDRLQLIATKSSQVMNTLVIPVQFQDLRFSFVDIHSKIYNLFNQLNYNYDGATGSVNDYFKDNVGQYGEFIFSVAPVVTASQKLSYYGANGVQGVDINIKNLVKEACTLASLSGINFADYDSNGDGTVDNVIIFFAGYNESEGGGDNTIWPQSWNIDDGFSIHGMKVSGFSCCSELSGSSGYSFTGIGTICHEYCHFLGMLDMYDVNGETEGLSYGLNGSISIMDYGNFNNNGKTPPYFNSIERSYVHNMVVEQPDHGTTVDLPPVYLSDRLIQFQTDSRGESFVVEYRDGSKWDRYIGGTGLLVYHIDKSENQSGSQSSANRWVSNSVNANAGHQCAYLISTSGAAAKTVSECFFPGGSDVSSIISTKSFPLMSWNGVGLGIGITDIGLGNLGYSINIVKDESWDLPVVTDVMVEPKQVNATLVWKSDKTVSYGNWSLIWGSSRSMTQDTIYLKNQSFEFTNLIPGETYDCKLFYQQGTIVGKEQTFSFRTIERKSDLPIIGFMDIVYHVGDIVNLVALNIVEEVDSIEWYINGKICKNDYFTVEKTGTFAIEARIEYPDKSVEILQKTLKIN